jgi:hypothetical protein
MVRNDQEATNFEALYMPRSCTEEVRDGVVCRAVGGVTKVGPLRKRGNLVPVCHTAFRFGWVRRFMSICDLLRQLCRRKGLCAFVGVSFGKYWAGTYPE